MKPEAFDFLNNLSTIWAIIIGAVLATAGGLIATWIERNIDRHHRERNAALFFGEMLSTLDVILEFATHARGIGDPYGPITMRFLRSARREIDIYDRNRETVFFLSDGVLRARIHTVILRLTMPLDGLFDFTQEIALTEAQLKALPPGDAERVTIRLAPAVALGGRLPLRLTPRGVGRSRPLGASYGRSPDRGR